MKKTKKIFALLLATAMIVGMMPFSVFAEGTDVVYCGQEDHEHSDDCQKELTCTVEVHTHTDACQKDCDIPEHTHSEECQKTCDLTEHTHTDACQKTCDLTEHTHTDACKTLTCEKVVHAHDDTCKTLTCQKEVHAHDDTCKRLTCEESAEDHVHDDNCYTLTCEKEVHAHDDTCYTLGCEKEVHAHDDTCYTRTCDVPEHTHSEECQKTCNITEHTHSEACQKTCDLTEHTHSEECQKTCNLTEHTHTDECYTDKECDKHVHTAACSVAPTMSTTIGDGEFIVGVAKEFTCSTVANGAAGRMVVGTSNFSDASAISKLEYYEPANGQWYTLSGDFGPSAGFPMSDATSKFRVTFAKAGEYNFTISMKLADTDEVLCSVNATATVNAPAPEVVNLTSVAVTVAEPKVGDAPSAAATAIVTDPANALAVADTQLIWLTSASASGDLKEWTPVSGNFEANTYYAAVLSIDMPEGYRFTDETDIKVNGKTAGYTSYNEKLAITYVFNTGLTPPPALVPLDKIEISINAPVVGAMPSDGSFVADSVAIRDGVFYVWLVNDTGSAEFEDDNWDEMLAGTPFEAGKAYAIHVVATGGEGLDLTDTVITVNGKAPVYSDVDDKGVLVVDYIFGKIGYTIINGANSTWKDNAKDGLAFRSDAPYAKFKGVKVDGKDLTSKDYTSKEGSTIVTLTVDFLKTLKVGTHTLAIVSNDGTATTTFTVEHVHVLKKVEKKDATCTEKGNKEYYACEGCEDLFEDANGQTKIVDKTTVEIPALGHKAEENWSFDGNQHWHKCSVCKEPADEKADHEYEADVTNSDGTVTKGHICKICKYDKDNPKTGDMTPLTLVAIVMGVCALGAIAVVSKTMWDKKKNK